MLRRDRFMIENTKPVTLMTIHEAAKTGIMPENTLRRMCRSNDVPCLHIGRRTRAREVSSCSDSLK